MTLGSSYQEFQEMEGLRNRDSTVCTFNFLYRCECYTEKYLTRKIYTKVHPGLQWRIFHILACKDINDVILYHCICKAENITKHRSGNKIVQLRARKYRHEEGNLI